MTRLINRLVAWWLLRNDRDGVVVVTRYAITELPPSWALARVLKDGFQSD